MSIEEKAKHLISSYGMAPEEAWIIAIEWDRNETVKAWMMDGEIESIPIVEAKDVTVKAERKVVPQLRCLADFEQLHGIDSVQIELFFRRVSALLKNGSLRVGVDVGISGSEITISYKQCFEAVQKNYSDFKYNKRIFKDALIACPAFIESPGNNTRGRIRRGGVMGYGFRLNGYIDYALFTGLQQNQE